jgi:hypothetical protein
MRKFVIFAKYLSLLWSYELILHKVLSWSRPAVLP